MWVLAMSRELQLPSPYIELLGPNPTLPVGLTLVTIPYGIAPRPFVDELTASLNLSDPEHGLLYDKLPFMDAPFYVEPQTRVLFFDVTRTARSLELPLRMQCRLLRNLAVEKNIAVVLVVPVSGYFDGSLGQLCAGYSQKIAEEADLELHVLSCESKNQQALWKVTRGKHRAAKTVTPIPVIEVPEIDRH